MAEVHQTAVYDVTDAKVYALLTDANNASPTYGPAIDVPGIAQVKLDPNLITAELKGDGGAVLRKRGRIDRFKFSATYDLLDFDVLEAIIGGAASDPDVHRSGFKFDASTVIPYFGLSLVFNDVDQELGVFQLACFLYKCQITAGTLLGGQTDQFSQPTFDADALRPNGFATFWYAELRDESTMDDDVTAMVQPPA